MGLKKFWAPALLLLLTGCQALTDREDLVALRRQCRIPDYAVLKEFHGFTGGGLGQREGLSLRAVFEVRESDAARFRADASREGWEKAPVPPSLRTALPRLDDDQALAAEGLFRCRTAGNDVLLATETNACTEDHYTEFASPNPSRRLSDAILTVYDEKNRTLTAWVRSTY